ncbi:MAG: hypothetical protein N2588_06575 [Rhodovarius sp.]|nr:hypothetical protein [Rhodovarius sp.]MCX7932195.1 hypothetical protein [Rhodovarius sp.]
MSADAKRRWFAPRRLEVPCTVEIENSFDSLHAYAIPEGVVLRPGDRVIVHNVPHRIAYGEAISYRTTATVIRAGLFRRLWTELSAIWEVAELYHCGFEPKEYAA